MPKPILNRLFGIGNIPKTALPILEAEGILVSDEGIKGWLKIRHLKMPGKYSSGKSSSFIGSLVLTRKRLAGYVFGKRQINILLDDPRMAAVEIELAKPNQISIAFDLAVFHENWNGHLGYKFKTDKAREFYDNIKNNPHHV